MSVAVDEGKQAREFVGVRRLVGLLVVLLALPWACGCSPGIAADFRLSLDGSVSVPADVRYVTFVLERTSAESAEWATTGLFGLAELPIRPEWDPEPEEEDVVQVQGYGAIRQALPP